MIIVFVAMSLFSVVASAAEYPYLALSWYAFLLWPVLGTLVIRDLCFSGRAVPFQYLLVTLYRALGVSRRVASEVLCITTLILVAVISVHYADFMRNMRIDRPGLLHISQRSYFGRIQYDGNGRQWKIREESLLSDDPDDAIDVAAEEQLLRKPGWVNTGVIHGRPAFTHGRTEDVTSKWYRLYTLNTITFQPFSISEFGADSNIEILAPRNMVGVSWPPVIHRSDSPDGDEEVVRVALASLPLGPDELQLQVFHPLLRNSISKAVLNLSIWDPLRWFVVALFAITGEQIRARWISPLVTKILDVLRIRNRTRTRRKYARQSKSQSKKALTP